jgi:predicted DNA-binding transcriptional regulator AlpA
MENELNVEPAVSASVCASILGASVSDLYRMARAGVVPCLRSGIRGRAVRFIPSEVQAALRARPVWTEPRGKCAEQKGGR